MTYAECYMLKKAETKSSPYETIASRMAAGDKTVSSAMATPTGQEIFWNLASAGLGAGGAYLLSRRLRRNGTKRQRAIDMVLGALLGIGGAQLVFNSTGDEQSGLTVGQTLRADRFLTESGQGTGDNSKRTSTTNPFAPNDRTVGGAVIGAGSGAVLGGMFGPFADITENRFVNKARAYKLPPARVDAAGRRGRFMGNLADIFGGGVLGGLFGYGVGAAGNAYAARQHELNGGGMN